MCFVYAWRRYALVQPLHIKMNAYRCSECRIIPRRLPVRLCSGSRLPGHFAGTLFVICMQEERCTMGFGAGGGAGICVFMGGLFRCVLLFWFSFICCYYLFYQIEALKIEIYKSKLLSNSKGYGNNNS